jgi:hypothetical protein
MRIVAIATTCLLGLASCPAMSMSISPNVATAGADIVNNIGLACNSAQQLLTIPGVVSPASAVVAAAAGKLASKVNIYCTGVQLAGPILLKALSQVNTAGAQLLGTGVAK